MAIKFKCPHCEKPLAVKDELAGKKGPCPGCKKVLVIPAAPAAVTAPPSRDGNGTTKQPVKAPTLRQGSPAQATTAPGKSTTAKKPDLPPGPSQAELEAAAASLLADEPPPPEVVNPQFVEFECPDCSEKIKLSADLAGKRAQCPSCRNLIKVPALEKKDPKDWRKGPAGPSGARQTLDPAAPEGAWGSATATQATKTALEEAGALPREKVKLTWQQWVTRGGLAAAIVLGVGSLGWYSWNLSAEGTNERAMKQALEIIDKAPRGDYRPEVVAEVKRAAGEYRLSTNRRNCADDARKRFNEARAILFAAPGVEREFVLRDLAISQVDLGGTPDEVADTLRIAWPDAVKDVVATLNNIHQIELKKAAIRDVARKLIARGQSGLAVGVAAQAIGATPVGPNVNPDDLRYDTLALVAVEAFSKDPKAAETQAQQMLDKFPEPVAAAPDKSGVKRLTLTPAMVALAYLVWDENKDKKTLFERKVLAPVLKQPPEIVGLGQIEALTRLNKLDEAQKLAEARNQPEAWMALASVLAEDDPAKAQPFAQKAHDLARGQKLPAWTAFRLAQLAAQCGIATDALELAANPDAGIVGQIQIQLLNGRLAAMKKTGQKVADVKAEADKIEPKSAAALLAWENLARHNAEIDAGTLNVVRGWEDRPKPLGLAGAVLGRRGLE